MQEKNNKFLILISILIFLTGFLTGFLTLFIIPEYRAIIEESKKPTLEEEISKNKTELNLNNFWEAYTFVKNNYYDVEKINNTEIEDGMTRGFIQSLGDSHSEFFTKKENEEFDSYMSGDFEGIGAYIEKNPFGIKINKLMKDSPAGKAGIIPGDILVKADETSLVGLSANEATKYLKGPKGSKVIFSILREGEEDLIEKEVERGVIITSSVFSEKIDNLGYIGINMFGAHTSQEVVEELNNLEKQEIEGIIIDLRLNGGGYVVSSVEIASQFLPTKEKIVDVKYKNFWENESYTSINNGKVFEKPIVIIIDSMTASASEILTLALKDHNKAIVVGEKSYGKGNIQVPHNLKNGSMIKVTIAKWFSPNGTNIDGIGITPEIEILFTKDDYKNLYDRQFEESKKILQKFIETGNKKETIEYFNKDKQNEEIK